jgi:hypothetical protein
MHLPHLGASLKILAFDKSVRSISSHSWTAASTSGSDGQLRWIPKISATAHFAVTFVFDVSHWPVWSSHMSIQPLPNPLHNFLTCYTLTLPSPYTSTNRWWILNRKTCFSPKHWIALQICLQDQVLNICKSTSTYPLKSISMGDSCAICWMLTLVKGKVTPKQAYVALRGPGDSGSWISRQSAH